MSWALRNDYGDVEMSTQRVNVYSGSTESFEFSVIGDADTPYTNEATLEKFARELLELVFHDATDID